MTHFLSIFKFFPLGHSEKKTTLLKRPRNIFCCPPRRPIHCSFLLDPSANRQKWLMMSVIRPWSDGGVFIQSNVFSVKRSVLPVWCLKAISTRKCAALLDGLWSTAGSHLLELELHGVPKTLVSATELGRNILGSRLQTFRSLLSITAEKSKLVKMQCPLKNRMKKLEQRVA